MNTEDIIEDWGLGYGYFLGMAIHICLDTFHTLGLIDDSMIKYNLSKAVQCIHIAQRCEVKRSSSYSRISVSDAVRHYNICKEGDEVLRLLKDHNLAQAANVLTRLKDSM